MAILLAGAQAGGQAPPPVAMPAPIPVADGDLLRYAFGPGATLIGATDDHIWVERYEPGGRLRGTHRGRTYAGRWSIEGDRLCTRPEGARQTCALVEGHLSMSLGPQAPTGFHLELITDDPQHPRLWVTYRHAAPWQSRTPVQTITGLVNRIWQDAFELIREGGGHDAVMIVRTGRRIYANAHETVRISGTSDGVIFTADRVTRPDGSAVP